MHECAWCLQRKTLTEMRHPASSKGKSPSTCHQCRELRPDLAWCDYHGESHSKSEFPLTDRPTGVNNVCRRARSIKASAKRDHDPITCVSCKSEMASWNYRGGQAKSPTCRDCESENAGSRWCVDCGWLPETDFHRTGEGGKFWTVRCKPCKVAHSHGVTVAQLLERQGSTAPECAACGSTAYLKIDHDHRCCPAQCGCAKCVRGYLCHECNTAEGLLKESGRALKLASYMQKFGF